MILAALALLPASAATWGFNTSILAASAGLLLVYLECNRPGRVVPGTAGVLLLLLALHSLSLLPLHPAAILLVVLAFLFLTLPARGVAVRFWLVAGTGLLVPALAHLSAQHAWSLPAALCGLVLGPVTGWLTCIAGRARRAKRPYRPLAVPSRPAALTRS